MSLHEYKVSQEISAQDYPFYALIMACFRKADSDNLEKLQRAFPAAWREFLLRYCAPWGVLKGESIGIPCSDPTVWLGGEEVPEEELPDVIMGIPVKVTEACPDPPGVLILGSFNDYDHREEPDGIDDTGN